MGIQLPSLHDIAGWLFHQLKVWFAILVDTRQFAREIAQESRVNIDDVIIRLIPLAFFMFTVDMLLFLPIDVFVWNLDVFSFRVFFSNLAIFSIQIVIYTTMIHILSVLLTRNRDLRVALSFVLLMLAFYPILHLCQAPLGVLIPREVMEALYASDLENFFTFAGIQPIGALTKLLVIHLIFLAVLVWYLRRATLALSEIYSIGSLRAFLVILPAYVGKDIAQSAFVNPLFLRMVGSQG